MTNSVGAVLAVGAGIGGIQASLDLADARFKVYLLDKSSAIVSPMAAQFDKTFPTNDYTICFLPSEPIHASCGACAIACPNKASRQQGQ